MRYDLAKGGCMHFRCPQCGHEFCSGCSEPFMQDGVSGTYIKQPKCLEKLMICLKKILLVTKNIFKTIHD